MSERTDYRLAACQDADPDLFFPLGDKETGPEVDMAKAWCRACPINEECLQDNIEAPFGIWGGTTPGQRRVILRRMGNPASKFYLNSRAMGASA